MSDITIHDRRRLLDDYLAVEAAEISFERDDGERTAPHRLLRVLRDDAAAVLLVDRARRELLLVEQFRWPTLEKGPGRLLEIVAGVIEPGESPEQTAAREALEEAGVLSGEMIPIARCYPTPGYSTERVHIFAAEVRPGAPAGAGGGVDVGEHTRVVRLPFGEVDGWLGEGRIADAKTLIALQWFVRKADLRA